MTREDVLKQKKARLAKIEARPDRKSHGVIRKLQREIFNLEKKS